MTREIIDGFFEDQKDFTAHVSFELETVTVLRRHEFKLDISGGQNICRELPHSLDQISEAVASGVDGPHYVAHRIHQLARSAGDRGEWFRRRGRARTQVMTSDFTEDGNLRKARADVVVQIRGYASTHSFELDYLGDAIPMERIDTGGGGKPD